VRCSGYTEEKDSLICDIFGDRYHLIRDKFKWYIYIDNYLCTHAGIHPMYLHPKINVANKKEVCAWLDAEANTACRNLITGQNHWFCYIGRSRYGNAPKGGITWLDWDNEFEPIEGVTQIVGHTHSRTDKIRKHHLDGNLSVSDGDLCIDCGLNQWITITNGRLEIKSYIDL
jgi:hypothetical protein